MKFVAMGDVHNVEVEGEQVSMPFTSDTFAVHLSLGPVGPARRFTVSHVATGFAVGFGRTPERAISASRAVWASRSPQEREEALFNAHVIKHSRITVTKGRPS